MSLGPTKRIGDWVNSGEQALGFARLDAETFPSFEPGWVWLVVEGGKLKVISTHDAATTVTQDGVTPILVCDVWEHAYYLDHQNNRKGFLEAWFDTLANWSLADAQFAASTGTGQAWAYPLPA